MTVSSPAAVFWSSLSDRDLDAAFAVVDAQVDITPAGVLGTATDVREFFASIV